MSVNLELQNYIEGSYDNDEAARHRVAAVGPTIIPQLLSSELGYLKHWGGSPQDFAAGFTVGNVIEKIRTRGERLVMEIASSSPQNGKQVGAFLVQASGDANPNIRALSILLCMQPGIPRSSYSQQVVQRFLHDNNDIVRLAAAVCMATIVDAPPEVRQESINMVMSFLTEYIQPKLPELENEIRFLMQRSRPDMDEGAQNLLVVASTLYYFMATR